MNTVSEEYGKLMYVYHCACLAICLEAGIIAKQ